MDLTAPHAVAFDDTLVPEMTSRVDFGSCHSELALRLSSPESSQKLLTAFPSRSFSSGQLQGAQPGQVMEGRLEFARVDESLLANEDLRHKLERFETGVLDSRSSRGVVLTPFRRSNTGFESAQPHLNLWSY